MSRSLAPDAAKGTDAYSVDDVMALLRSKGGRVTHARRILVEALFEADHHLSAEEIAEAAQAKAPDVHLSTVYRNLDELQRLGVVVHHHLGHGPTTYELAWLAHGHFICEHCGTMIEAPDKFFVDLARSAKSQFGFAIDPHHVAIVGLCAHCS